jgi:hypothetical protein
LAEKEFQRAVSWCALMEMLLNRDHINLHEPDRKAMQEVLTQGKKKLGKSAYEAAYAEGKSLSLDEQIMKLMII